MLYYVLGILLLVGCLLGLPLVRRVLHERTLRGLGMEGVTVVPRVLRLSGLRLRRARWEGEAFFESSGLGDNHRAGHVRLRATFASAVPPLAERTAADAAIRTGDEGFDQKIVVSGDPAFARKLLVPEMRERLVRLDQQGGRVLAIGDGTIEIDGPLPARTQDLRTFLELCDAIVDGTVAAAGG